MPIIHPPIPPVYVLAGLTGSGKTAIIRHLREYNHQALDLESMCRHDGSVFAKLQYGDQPSSYEFHKQLLKEWERFDPSKPVFVESELNKLGRITLPSWLREILIDAPVIWLETIKSVRVERISTVIRNANPIGFCNCLMKLDQKLGAENLRHCFEYFEQGRLKELAELLLEYYDHVPGYQLPAERVILRLHVESIDVKAITNTLLAAVNNQALQEQT